jgi:hypothetical protein
MVIVQIDFAAPFGTHRRGGTNLSGLERFASPSVSSLNTFWPI